MTAGTQTRMRERILDAAPEVLRRFTLAKFSMEDVARAAGIARQTVYKHFDGRDDLLISIYLRELDEHHHPRLAQYADRAPSRDGLVELFLAELAVTDHFPLIRELLEPSGGPRMAEIVFNDARMTEAREAFWLPVLQRHVDAAVVRPGLDLRAAVRWITYQQFWLLAHPDVLYDDEATRDMYVRSFILGGVLVDTGSRHRR